MCSLLVRVNFLAPVGFSVFFGSSHCPGRLPFYKGPVMKTKYKKALAAWPMLAAFIVSASVYVSGCLSPAELAAINTATVASESAFALMESLEPEIAKVRKMIEEKKIDEAEGEAIIKVMVGRKDELKRVYEENKNAVAAMKAADVPWHGYLIYGLNILVGLAGSAFGIKKVGKVTAAVGSLSRGLDEHMNKKMIPEERAALRTTLGLHAEGDGTTAALKALHRAATGNTI